MINIDSDIDYKWIVQKVDFSNYDNCIEVEKSTAEDVLQLQQKAVIENAKKLLSEKTGIALEELKKL